MVKVRHLSPAMPGGFREWGLVFYQFLVGLKGLTVISSKFLLTITMCAKHTRYDDRTVLVFEHLPYTTVRSVLRRICMLTLGLRVNIYSGWWAKVINKSRTILMVSAYANY